MNLSLNLNKILDLCFFAHLPQETERREIMAQRMGMKGLMLQSSLMKFLVRGCCWENWYLYLFVVMIVADVVVVVAGVVVVFVVMMFVMMFAMIVEIVLGLV